MKDLGIRKFAEKTMREYGRWWGIEAKDTDKFIADLTILISEEYVEKTAYIALENMLARAEVNSLKLLKQRDELRDENNDLRNILSEIRLAYDELGQFIPARGAEAAIKSTEQ